MTSISGFVLASRSEDDLTDSANNYSVKRLLEAARARGIDMQVYRPDQFELVVTQNDQKSILINDKPMPLPDFVIPFMGASTSYYALSVIRQLENLGVCVCNTARAISAVKDKLYLHQCLASSRLVSPKTMLAKFPINLEIVEREIGFPLVIKNVTGSLGKGIYLCESDKKFTDVMELIYTNNAKANIILQEFVKNSHGQDLRILVVGGKVIACMRRSSKDSFKANFSKGGNVEPYEVTPEIEWLSTETAKLFKLDLAGIDLLFDDNRFVICEANSSPGFKGMELVTGKIIAEKIIDYIMVKIGKNVEGV